MLGSELVALAVGGTDWGTWMRQTSYNTFGWPHIEFDDMDSFITQVLFHTGVWHRHTPALPGGAKPGTVNNAAHAQAAAIQPLTLLTILSHGGFSGPIMGSGEGDILTRERIFGRQSQLALMRKCFSPQSEVVFGGCVIGLNPWLLADLSVIWGGIKVTGYTDLQKFGSLSYSGDKVTLQGRSLIAGQNTEHGQEYLKHPHDRVRKADMQMGAGTKDD